MAKLKLNEVVEHLLSFAEPGLLKDALAAGGARAACASFLQSLICEDEACAEDEHALSRLFARALPLMRREWHASDSKTSLAGEILWPDGGVLRDRGRRSTLEDELRKRRLVSIERECSDPIEKPESEILWSANILLTVPLSAPVEHVSPSIAKTAIAARSTAPSNFYDHPVPIGTPPEQNEILYGLHHLDAAFAEEAQLQSRATKPCPVLLSASVTHTALGSITRPYVNQLLSRETFEHLSVFLVTEQDTLALVELLAEVSDGLSGRQEREEGISALRETLGVDGSYGRHYSFLRAGAVFLQTVLLPDLKATFKVDLDQVMLPERTRRETGATLLEHLRTPLWGADARDFAGRRIHLGGLSGRLVNQSDANQSLWVPDVDYVDTELTLAERVFLPKLPQALSTKVEMLTRPDAGSALHRYHVTGGATGFRLDALSQYRPFTPSFIGRAEDQAFILPVLLGPEPSLRTLHAPGVVMRHDKAELISEAIDAAAPGKWAGDLLRVLLFSRCAQAQVWPLSEQKSELAPFTGGFITETPITQVFLSLACTLVEQELQSEERAEAAVAVLAPALEWLAEGPEELRERLSRERLAWNTYYDVLLLWRERIEAGDDVAVQMRQRARDLTNSWLIGSKQSPD